MAQPHVKKMAGAGGRTGGQSPARNPNVAFRRLAPRLPDLRNTLPLLANCQTGCGNAAYLIGPKA